MNVLVLYANGRVVGVFSTEGGAADYVRAHPGYLFETEEFRVDVGVIVKTRYPFTPKSTDPAAVLALKVPR